MKKSILFSALLALAITSIFIGCNKEDEISPNDKNTLTLEFDNRVGTQNLEMGSKTYKNALGEDFSVTTFNYFISNIKLKKADGSEVKIDNQYFLLREADAKSLIVSLKDVPAADYKEVSFMVGVDSLKSIADIALRTGVLDPASYKDDNMYWSWNSGYIFMKFEGVSPVAPERASGIKKIEMHVGGFGGRTAITPNNLRTVILSINDLAKVRKNSSPEVHLFVDVLKLMEGSTMVSLKTTNNVHSPAIATPIANNYMKMFSVDHVHN